MLHTHSPLIICASTGTRYCVAVAALKFNTYVVHNAYTLCTVHEQDSVMVRHKRKNYKRAIARVLM